MKNTQLIFKIFITHANFFFKAISCRFQYSKDFNFANNCHNDIYDMSSYF